MLKHLLVATVAFPLLQAAQRAEPAYQTANTRISTDYQADKLACTTLTEQAREVCLEQARARKKVTRAELEYSQGGQPRDHHKVLEARAEAAYEVARQKCGDRMARLKALCLLDAQTVEAEALADAARPPLEPPPEGVRVRRSVVETHKPVVATFKAVAL